MKYINFFSLGLILLFACDPTNSDQEDPTPKCQNVLTINDTREEFCGGKGEDLASQLVVGDSLILMPDRNQSHDNQSKNYLGYRLTFAAKKPAANDYESELEFFQNILDKMAPRSIHDFNINQDGGFALEVWARDGSYYSTEFGIQQDSAHIKILDILIDINGSGQVNNQVVLDHEGSEGKITLWNEKGQFIIVNPFYHRFLGLHSW